MQERHYRPRSHAVIAIQSENPITLEYYSPAAVRVILMISREIIALYEKRLAGVRYVILDERVRRIGTGTKNDPNHYIGGRIEGNLARTTGDVGIVRDDRSRMRDSIVAQQIEASAAMFLPERRIVAGEEEGAASGLATRGVREICVAAASVTGPGIRIGNGTSRRRHEERAKSARLTVQQHLRIG